MTWPRRRLVALSMVGLALSACAGERASPTPTTLRVFAAASLHAAFTDLVATFEAANEGVDVELTFAGSSSLVAQIEQGAPAHVLATADEDTMRPVVEAGASTPVVFARNPLAVIVERGNPMDIDSLDDLARPDVALVVCAPAVPCGRLALLLLEGIEIEPRSLEENVRAVVSKVALGEADAGVVYATDVGGDVEEVRGVVPDDPSLHAVYPITVLTGAPQPEASAFVEHVRSEEGRAVLDRLGFLAP